ncbi:hypothetical protein ACWIF8_15015 [Micromonospora chalcea]
MTSADWSDVRERLARLAAAPGASEGSGFRPLHDHDGTPLGFARWYRRWLEQAEDQVAPVGWL